MKFKIKTITTKPEVTDEEIRSYMDFDALLQKSKSNKPAFSKNLLIASLLVGIVAIGTVSYFIGQKSDHLKESIKPKPTIENLSQPHLKSSIPIVKNDSTDETIEKENNSIKKEVEIKSIPPTKKVTDQPSGEIKTIEKKSDSLKVTSTSNYLQAEPIEGFPHLYEYFSSEIKYPEEAVKDSIQGVVTVSFIVTKEGKHEQVKIINSLGPLFDNEVMRLIENMPGWKPAYRNQKPVASKVQMPLTFRLERIKK